MCKNQVYSSNTRRYLRRHPVHFCRNTNIMIGLKEQTEVYLSQYTPCNTLREHKTEAHVMLCYMHCIPASSNLPFEDWGHSGTKDSFAGLLFHESVYCPSKSVWTFSMSNFLSLQLCNYCVEAPLFLFWVFFFTASFDVRWFLQWKEVQMTHPESTHASNFQQMPYLPLSFALHLHHRVISFFDVI